jgi:endonuclease YncB( thermonuclease family)
MRFAHAVLGVLMVGATAAVVATGRRNAAPPASDISVDAQGVAEARPEATVAPSAKNTAQPAHPAVRTPARAIDPETIAPPDTGKDGLERVEPRPPLSDLALAGPPKPVMPEDWKGTTLFRPVAEESAIFSAMGRRIAIAGVESIPTSETCRTKGVEWPCGMNARGAVRRWLRGRALVCAVPPETERTVISAACRLGKQDVGAWLVSNGWARAEKAGPYTKAQDAAQKFRMGIFGDAPDLSGLPPPPPPVETTTPVSPSILDLSGTAATPPVAPPEPAR